MSRELPRKPSLEFLKKEAKDLLRRSGPRIGQGKLADAQHALANEYGFSTWAKLKSHVEALGLTPAEALSYAMSLPVAVTISGIDALSVLRQNLAIARGFTPLIAPQMQALRDRCAPVAADGHLELYKTTLRYDGDQGRAQHGLPPPNELPL